MYVQMMHCVTVPLLLLVINRHALRGQSYQLSRVYLWYSVVCVKVLELVNLRCYVHVTSILVSTTELRAVGNHDVMEK